MEWVLMIYIHSSGQGLNNMKSGYIYLDESELLLIKSALLKSKDESSSALCSKIELYKNNFWSDKNKNHNVYKNLAVDKFVNLNPSLIENEEITFDDDALVASSKNGAYVHCWVWIDNVVKPKRTRKKTV